MARRRHSGASKLLSRVRAKGKPRGRGARLVAALKKLVARAELTPGQHVAVKVFWRDTERTKDKSTKTLRGKVSKYLRRIQSKARRASDPRIERMRVVQRDASEVGIPPENVKVFVKEKGRRGVRRYSISSLERFLTLSVYDKARDKTRELTARVAVQTEEGTEGEVLETVRLE